MKKLFKTISNKFTMTMLILMGVLFTSACGANGVQASDDMDTSQLAVQSETDVASTSTTAGIINMTVPSPTYQVPLNSEDFDGKNYSIQTYQKSIPTYEEVCNNSIPGTTCQKPLIPEPEDPVKNPGEEIPAFGIVIVSSDTTTYKEVGGSDELEESFTLKANETAELVSEVSGYYLISKDGMEGFIPKENVEVLNGVFVIVDISEQHLYLYDYEDLLLETDVVTGTENSRDTTLGRYQIYSMEKGRYLRGPGYCSWVDYWMPFNGGIGLHDASWRDEFGDEIYKTSGSHGCVNIPSEYAGTIYESVRKGTTVIVQP